MQEIVVNKRAVGADLSALGGFFDIQIKNLKSIISPIIALTSLPMIEAIRLSNQWSRLRLLLQSSTK